VTAKASRLKILDACDEQSDCHTSEDQLLGFHKHLFLNGAVKWKKVLYRAHYVVAIAKHKKQREHRMNSATKKLSRF